MRNLLKAKSNSICSSAYHSAVVLTEMQPDSGPLDYRVVYKERFVKKVSGVQGSDAERKRECTRENKGKRKWQTKLQ